MIADAITGDIPIAMVFQNSRVLRICVFKISWSSTPASTQRDRHSKTQDKRVSARRPYTMEHKLLRPI
jgi:hypothetical protein